MDALVLCGGRGTRLDRGEKPLVTVCGEPMLDRVVHALADARVGTTYAVTSPHAPETTRHARSLGLSTIETPGEGYVADLDAALGDARVSRPVLTVGADLPLLTGGVVDAVLAARPQSEQSLTVCVPVALKERLGVSVDTRFDHGGTTVAPTGLNVVAGPTDRVIVRTDERLAVNVNHPQDLAIAEERCG